MLVTVTLAAYYGQGLITGAWTALVSWGTATSNGPILKAALPVHIIRKQGTTSSMRDFAVDWSWQGQTSERRA